MTATGWQPRPAWRWLAGATEPITRWWLGQLSWRQLLLQPEVTIHGDRALQRQMSRWFLRYAYTRRPSAPDQRVERSPGLEALAQSGGTPSPCSCSLPARAPPGTSPATT